MKKKSSSHVKRDLAAYLLFPSVVGALTGLLIFLFKITASFVMTKSALLYRLVRENPAYLPFLALGGAGVGLLSALILRKAKEARGGGIPTAVASIRGLIPMKWIQGIFAVFTSSMFTYLIGVPLGNEGPSVQMGAAVGKGASALFGKKNRAWERHNMTGGACAGFAIATGAPLTGMLFALEEAHRRISASIILFASVSVLVGTTVQKLLSNTFGVQTHFLDLDIREILPLRFLWVALLIGVGCGVCSLLFTRIYRSVRSHNIRFFHKIPFLVRIPLIFGITVLLGVLSEDLVGTGHGLIEKIFERHALVYFLLAVLLIRALMMIFSNTVGVTGGLFVPTLTFGAIVAALFAELLIALGWIEPQYYAILIVIGMASFLSASSRIPLTALVFAAEALCAASNLLPVAVGVVIAFLIVELSGKPDFTDTVLDARTEDAHRGKTSVIVNCHMTVQPEAFAIGKEIREILWPTTCTVLSVQKTQASHHTTKIEEGDRLHLHYETYDPSETITLLTHILGEQPEDKEATISESHDGHVVPD